MPSLKLHDMITVERAKKEGDTVVRRRERVRRDERVLEFLRQGIPIGIAARCAGICRATFYVWLNKGKKATRGKFFEFYEAVQEATAHAEVSMVLQIRRQAEDDWRAASWLLSHRFPERWSKAARIEVTGEGGGAVQVEHGAALPVDKMSEAQLAIVAWPPAEPGLQLPPPDPDTIDAEDQT